MGTGPGTGKYFEDFAVGDEFMSELHTVTRADVEDFARVTRDANSLHLSLEESRAQGYPGQLAHGLLGLSLAIGLLSPLRLFDGTAVGLLGLDDWRFNGPVLVGDQVRSRMLVVGLRPSSTRPREGLLTRRLTLEGADGSNRMSGTATMLLRRKEGPKQP